MYSIVLINETIVSVNYHKSNVIFKQSKTSHLGLNNTETRLIYGLLLFLKHLFTNALKINCMVILSTYYVKRL